MQTRRDLLRSAAGVAAVPFLPLGELLGRFSDSPDSLTAEMARSVGAFPFEASDYRVYVVGFDAAIKGREHKYPTLAASLPTRPAYSTQIEWVEDVRRGARLERRCFSNHMQIIRTPWSSTPWSSARLEERTDDMLEEHLAAVELTLVEGVPSSWRAPGTPAGSRVEDAGTRIGTCGGLKFYRRHGLRGAPTLRPLRDLVLWEHELGRDWLSEFSLQVDA